MRYKRVRMWLIRTYFEYVFSESDSRFSVECARGYIEILEIIQDSNHARGTKMGEAQPTSGLR